MLIHRQTFRDARCAVRPGWDCRAFVRFAHEDAVGACSNEPCFALLSKTSRVESRATLIVGGSGTTVAEGTTEIELWMNLSNSPTATTTHFHPL